MYAQAAHLRGVGAREEEEAAKHVARVPPSPQACHHARRAPRGL